MDNMLLLLAPVLCKPYHFWELVYLLKQFEPRLFCKPLFFLHIHEILRFQEVHYHH